jgi:flagella basal body P-ring formation protein FlgA
VEKISYGNNIYYQNKDDIKIDFVRSNYGSSNVNLNNGYKNYSLYAYIKVYKTAFVAARDIKSNEPIEGNVKMEKIEVTNNYTSLVQAVEGFMAKRNIKKGEPILVQYIVEKPALLRGTKVKIRYQGDFILVETKGILKEDAFNGKYLRVENTNTGKIITAKYIGSGIVLVN